MTAEMVALFTEFNVADDPTERTLIHSEYLQVTAVRQATASEAGLIDSKEDHREM
jgi:hypothetical protein